MPGIRLCMNRVPARLVEAVFVQIGPCCVRVVVLGACGHYYIYLFARACFAHTDAVFTPIRLCFLSRHNSIVKVRRRWRRP